MPQANNYQKRKGQTILFLVLAGFSLLGASFDQHTFRFYGKPLVSSSEKRLYLAYTHKSPLRSHQGFFLLESPDGRNWTQARAFTGSPSVLASIGEGLFLFFQDGSYCVYEGGEWQSRSKWPHIWEVGACAEVGGKPWVFGIEGGTYVRSARWDGRGWEESPVLLTLEGEGKRIWAVSIREGAFILVQTKGPGGEEQLFLYAIFDGQKWRELGILAADEALHFTLVGNDGASLFFTRAKEGEKRPIILRRRFTPEGWAEAEEIHPTDEVDPSRTKFPKSFTALSAVIFKSKPHIFYSTLSSIRVIIGDGHTWRAPQMIVGQSKEERMHNWAWVICILSLFALFSTSALSLVIYRAERNFVGQEMDLATWLERAGAAFLDFIILTFLAILFFLIIGRLQAERGIMWILSFFGSIIFMHIAYGTFFEARWGKTIGKMVFGIRVVKDTGEGLDLKEALIRNILRLVDMLVLYALGSLVMVSTPRFQRVGDLLARTIVIKEGR